jgi:hypothetical protein
MSPQSSNLAPPPLQDPGSDAPRPTPAEGDWYVPQGDDAARPIDYFKDDRPLIGRIVGLAMLAMILAITATLAAAWYALPLLDAHPRHRPAIYDGPAPLGTPAHMQGSPTTHPVAHHPTSAPAENSASGIIQGEAVEPAQR